MIRGLLVPPHPGRLQVSLSDYRPPSGCLFGVLFLDSLGVDALFRLSDLRSHLVPLYVLIFLPHFPLLVLLLNTNTTN